MVDTSTDTTSANDNSHALPPSAPGSITTSTTSNISSESSLEIASGSAVTRQHSRIQQLLRRNNYNRVGTRPVDDDHNEEDHGRIEVSNDGDVNSHTNRQTRRRVPVVVARSGEAVANMIGRNRTHIGRNNSPERTRLTTVSTDDETNEDVVISAESGNSSSATNDRGTNVISINGTNEKSDSPPSSDSSTTYLNVTILDFMHQKFQVPVPVNGSVLDLKRCGQNVHKVPIARQRLIYRGKLLVDESSLHESGIVSDGVIVHLFPKPRVVVRRGNDDAATETNGGNSSDNVNNNENNTDGTNTNGARVPTIVLNADEAERRSQILVLGSPDYLEAQNNVKLFSFMLLIISSIELLNLLAIAMGVPQDQSGATGGASPDGSSYNGGPFTDNVDDDITFPPSFDGQHNGTNGGTNSSTSSGGNPYDPTAIDPAAALIYQTWSNLSYIDLFVSIAGVYVACLGIKASNDNQLRVAKFYLYGTCLTAAGWLIYNYIISLKVDFAIQAEEQQAMNGHNDDNNSNSNNTLDDDLYSNNNSGGYSTNTVMSDDDVYNQAFQVMVLPAMVWMLCIFRAYQFSSLLQEAEMEAQNRIRDELRLVDDDYDVINSNDNNNNSSSIRPVNVIIDNNDVDDDEEAVNRTNNNNLPSTRRREQVYHMTELTVQNRQGAVMT